MDSFAHPSRPWRKLKPPSQTPAVSDISTRCSTIVLPLISTCRLRATWLPFPRALSVRQTKNTNACVCVCIAHCRQRRHGRQGRRTAKQRGCTVHGLPPCRQLAPQLVHFALSFGICSTGITTTGPWLRPQRCDASVHPLLVALRLRRPCLRSRCCVQRTSARRAQHPHSL